MEIPERFRAKIDRATELVTVIHGELAAYHADEPFAFRSERLDDPPRLILYLDSVREPPLRFGVLMGEFIHNLRSTLDHLVWQLALSGTDTPSNRLQFPIYTTEPKKWDSIAADRLNAVPDEAVALIRQMQPFHADHPEATALAVIQALSNEDKHRVILETVSISTEPAQKDFDVQANMDVEDDMELEMPVDVPLRPGMKALTVYYTPIGPKPGLHVTGTVPVDIGFGSIGFRAAAMPRLMDDVLAHVRALDRFLS
jgi:hypothetical protein